MWKFNYKLTNFSLRPCVLYMQFHSSFHIIIFNRFSTYKDSARTKTKVFSHSFDTYIFAFTLQREILVVHNHQKNFYFVSCVCLDLHYDVY